MTSSRITPAAPAVVAGPACHAPELSNGVELTLLLHVQETAAGLPSVVDRVCEALYAQCITFEMVGVTSDNADAAWAAGFSAASGRWVGYLDCTDGMEIDPYGFVEEVHRARESRRPARAAA